MRHSAAYLLRPSQVRLPTCGVAYSATTLCRLATEQSCHQAHLWPNLRHNSSLVHQRSSVCSGECINHDGNAAVQMEPQKESVLESLCGTTHLLQPEQSTCMATWTSIAHQSSSDQQCNLFPHFTNGFLCHAAFVDHVMLQLLQLPLEVRCQTVAACYCPITIVTRIGSSCS